MYEDEIPVGRANNLQGKIFGRLTVLYRVANMGNEVAWKCKCECGTIKNIRGHSLTSGRTVSCGCYNREISSVNLSNQKFGKLTAIKPTDKRAGGSIVWECQCDCGNTCYVGASDLKTKNVQSCGCLIRQDKIINLTGQRFGYLTILEQTKERSGSSIIWKCKCDCGNIAYVSSNNLRRGKTKSCGCFCITQTKKANTVDLSNQKFGKLIALEPTDKRHGRAVVWKCKCECGNICFVDTSHLHSGHTQSCGCIRSRGEEFIAKIYREANISYEQQKSFNTCRFKETNSMARFDFWVNNSYLVEYDGIQHFEFRESIISWNNQENFIKTQERDKIKTQWCKENNIPLIRIPYTKLDTLCLEDLMLETTQFRVV